MSARGEPSYDLAEIKAKVSAGFFVLTHAALEGAAALGFDRSDIEECIHQLDEVDFYKTMAATAKPGLMQDVYRPSYRGVGLYVKVQLSSSSRAVVISFKKDQSP